MSPHPRTREAKSATWEDRLSAQVGRNIANTRARLGVSAQELSDRLAALGSPLPRPTISQIETGQRTVSLAEALATAAALGVPPVELVYAPSPTPVEALPGEMSMSGAEAADWLRGDIPRPAAQEPRWKWSTRAAETQAAGLTVNPWLMVARAERQLYLHDKNANDAMDRLATAADQTDRFNAAQAHDAAEAAAIRTARQLDLYLRTANADGAWEPARETLALIDLYKTRELPEQGIHRYHLTHPDPPPPGDNDSG
ncbi:MAG: helix-turn-helix domain-containing protein [Bifidobacteriaceae bacterium]|jgi:transcriptional regulator with XRE-family HTH domain|nr:helix-turn-helix domain-containing protein [Bifidobacteriaceae bacterium]